MRTGERRGVWGGGVGAVASLCFGDDGKEEEGTEGW